MSEQQSFSVVLGDRGRVVLPAPVRRRLNLHPGDRLILTVGEDGTASLVSAVQAARALEGIFKDIAPGRSLVDELIAERREEARREAEDD